VGYNTIADNKALYTCSALSIYAIRCRMLNKNQLNADGKETVLTMTTCMSTPYMSSHLTLLR